MTTPQKFVDMTTAVDTNILLDVVLANSDDGPESSESLRNALQRGPVLVCDIVYAELVPAFGSRAALDAALRTVGATVSPINTDIAFAAGLRWGQYRRAGGPRTRILSDFLIGAHAVATAGTFLTRDRGFYATYFPKLKIN
jgi:predicted nucleic acid-binding protein